MIHKSFLSLALAGPFITLPQYSEKMASIKAVSPRRSLKCQDSAVREGIEKWCLISLNHPHERIWFSNGPCEQALPSSFYWLFRAADSNHDLSQDPSFILTPRDRSFSAQTHRHSCSPRSPPPSHSASMGPQAEVICSNEMVAKGLSWHPN